MSLRILTAENIKQLVTDLPIKTLLFHTAKLFHRVSRKPDEIQCPHRSKIEGERFTALIMPAQISELGMSVKVVAVPRSGVEPNGIGGQSNTGAAKSIGNANKEPNQQHSPGTRTGLPATTIVFEESTGIAKAVVNARELTALRTAAGSLLASQLLLVNKPAPREVTFFGAGLQIEYHARMLLEGFPSIERCYVLNRTPNTRATGLVDRLARTYPSRQFELFTANGSHATGHSHTMGAPLPSELITVAGTGKLKSTGTDTWYPHYSLQADILCFATSATTPLINASSSSSIKPGAHLILVGSFDPAMHEVSTEVIRRASKVVVDSREHAMREAGELIDAGLDENRDVVELGELIDEDGKPISSMVEAAQKGDITIFKSVGLAVQDVMITRLLCTLSEENSVGTVIDEFD